MIQNLLGRKALFFLLVSAKMLQLGNHGRYNRFGFMRFQSFVTLL